MEKAWQTHVKNGMRNQDILDLHDYYYFHRNRKDRIKIIKTEVLEGIYKPKSPYIVRMEKTHGICRHIEIPSAEDAVILQTIVECLAPIIEKAHPNDRACTAVAKEILSRS